MAVIVVESLKYSVVKKAVEAETLPWISTGS
jgi:hypothetical protein